MATQRKSVLIPPPKSVQNIDLLSVVKYAILFNTWLVLDVSGEDCLAMTSTSLCSVSLRLDLYVILSFIINFVL